MHTVVSHYVSNPSLPLGNYFPALQVGIILLPPPGKGTKREICCLSTALLPQVQTVDRREEPGSEAVPQALLLLVDWPPWAPPPLQASRQLRRAGAWGTPQGKGLERREARETQDCCPPRDRVSAASLTVVAAQGALEPREGPFPCLPSPGPWWLEGSPGPSPFCPLGVERQGGLGKSWGRAGRQREPQS